MNRKWTAEEANEWYDKLEWLRGCNFIGSDCANRLDMWQKYKCEEKLATAERELALCQEIGFNTVRLWANFDVYYAEPDSYMEIFDRVTSYAFSHFSDTEYGEWYGYLRRDGKPTEPACKGHTYKGPFHVMRMLAKCLTMLDD